MPAPRVYNRHHGDAPPDAIYIGRGSAYGNRFVIGEHGSRDDVIKRLIDVVPLPQEEAAARVRRG